MRNTLEESNGGAKPWGSRRRPNLSRLVIGLALTSVLLTPGAAQSLTGRGMRSARPPCRSHPHYAGQCDVRDPCATYESRTVRYGDDRDFECFIVDEN